MPDGSVKSWKLKLNVPSELIAEAGRVKVIGWVPAGPSVQVSVTVIEVPMTVVPVNRGLVRLVTGTPPTVVTWRRCARVGAGGGRRRRRHDDVGRLEGERQRDRVALGPGVVGGEDLDRLQAVGPEGGRDRDGEVAEGVGRVARADGDRLAERDLARVEAADDLPEGRVAGGLVDDRDPGGVAEPGDLAEAVDGGLGGRDDRRAVGRGPGGVRPSRRRPRPGRASAPG